MTCPENHALISRFEPRDLLCLFLISIYLLYVSK